MVRASGERMTDRMMKKNLKHPKTEGEKTEEPNENTANEGENATREANRKKKGDAGPGDTPSPPLMPKPAPPNATPIDPRIF